MADEIFDLPPDDDGLDLKDTGLRGTIFSTVTGRRGADVSGGDEGDLKDKLVAAYGPGEGSSGVNTAAAAADLGVSQRTVQRWITSGQEKIAKPRKAQREKLRNRSRQAATTKAGRRRAMKNVAGDKLSRYGGHISVTGLQGSTFGSNRWYMRDRTTTLELTPTQVDAMRDAWIEGGHEGYVAWMRGTWDENYLENWGFGSIDEIDLESM